MEARTSKRKGRKDTGRNSEHKRIQNLVYTVKKMQRLLELYRSYPKDTASFGAWHQQVSAEMKEVKDRFPVNPV